MKNQKRVHDDLFSFSSDAASQNSDYKHFSRYKIVDDTERQIRDQVLKINSGLNFQIVHVNLSLRQLRSITFFSISKGRSNYIDMFQLRVSFEHNIEFRV